MKLFGLCWHDWRGVPGSPHGRTPYLRRPIPGGFVEVIEWVDCKVICTNCGKIKRKNLGLFVNVERVGGKDA